MGMKLSPLAWQAQMDAVFFEELLQIFICYIDDVMPFSRDFERSLLMPVESILQKVEKAGLSLSISKKSEFRYSQVKLLGYIVSRAELQMMDPAKTTLRNLQWPMPTNVHELNRFISVIQYYHSRFIPHLTQMLACCMNGLKKKNVRFHWTTNQHETQFQALKQALMTDPIMRLLSQRIQ